MTNRTPDKPRVRMWVQPSGPPMSFMGVMYESTDNEGRRYFHGIIGNEKFSMYADRSGRNIRAPVQWRLYTEPLARPPRPIVPGSGK